MGKMYEIDYELIDGETIRLTQGEYEGVSLSVDLHPAQLHHITRELCGVDSPAVGEAERKLGVLVDRLQEIVCDSWNRRVLSSGEDESRILERLDALLDLGIEMDGRGLEPVCLDQSAPQSEPKCAHSGDSKPSAPQKTAKKPSAEVSEQLPLVS